MKIDWVFERRGFEQTRDSLRDRYLGLIAYFIVLESARL